MNKQIFLKQLREQMIERNIVDQGIEDILEDYSMMIDEALDNGLEEEEYIKRLGTPAKIASSLKNEHRKEKVKDSKIVALSPFVSVVIYFVMGYFYHLWHPGWLVFLLIPIAGVLFGTDETEERFVGLTPFISVIVFILLGTYKDLWHPGWLIFFLIPFTGALLLMKGSKRILGLIGYGVIPLIYLYVNHTFGINAWYGLIFVPTLAIGIYTGTIGVSFHMSGDNDAFTKAFRWKLLVTFAGFVIVYFLFNVVFGLWHPTWVLFMFYPMIVLCLVKRNILEEEIPFVAYTPFFATILFVLVGYAFDLYHLSWMFYLLIPVIAILQDKE